MSGNDRIRSRRLRPGTTLVNEGLGWREYLSLTLARPVVTMSHSRVTRVQLPQETYTNSPFREMTPPRSLNDILTELDDSVYDMNYDHDIYRLNNSSSTVFTLSSPDVSEDDSRLNLSRQGDTGVCVVCGYWGVLTNGLCYFCHSL